MWALKVNCWRRKYGCPMVIFEGLVMDVHKVFEVLLGVPILTPMVVIRRLFNLQSWVFYDYFWRILWASCSAIPKLFFERERGHLSSNRGIPRLFLSDSHLRDYLKQFLTEHLNYKSIFKGLSGTIFKYHLSLRVDIITQFWRDCFEGLSEL